MADHLFEVKDLTMEFSQDGKKVIAANKVSYYLDEGEVVAFVGESGSGKSVTQYTGLQLVPCPPGHLAGGQIIFEGEDILDYPTNGEQMRKIRGGKIGVVFQEPMTSLNPVMTIGKQITESLKLHLSLNQKEANARAMELLQKVGLPDVETRMKSYPHQLSGGMRQRIMIAMALSCNPKILIADEATTALDVTTQAQILELLKEMVKETKTTLVIVTHNLSLVARYADRVYVMYAGELVESGKTDELFYNPQHPYTIGLMNAIPSMTAPREKKLIPIPGVVGSLSDREPGCMFAPRCPYAKEICKCGGKPDMMRVAGSDSHEAACRITVDEEMRAKAGIFGSERPKKNIDPEAEPLLSVENLSVKFPVYSSLMHRKIGEVSAVDNVSFTLHKGETFGLVGESGCGKTTVAKAIMRLEDVSSGKILLDGNDITHLPEKQLKEYRRNMAMIFQDPYGSLDPRQRVGDTVMEPLINFKLGYSKAELNKRVDELFRLVGLSPSQRERLPHEFSGGQRQRIVIARALATNPRLIVCDEAISALDVSIQAQLINLLEELQEQLGLSYLFIAHDLSVVRHISDRIAVMYLGQLVEYGDWKQLYEDPRHPYTQALLDSVPIPDPKEEREREPRRITGEVPSPMNRPKGCAFSTRCKFATEKCFSDSPEMKKIEDGHFASCFIL